MSVELTPPEHTYSRRQARSIGAQVRDAGGCRFCVKRSRLFEGKGSRGACGLSPPKNFPACIESTREGFEFDEAAYRDAVGAAG